MIPAKILKFLEQHANVGFAGTRDSQLVPFGHRLSAWKVAPDGTTLTVLVAGPFTDRLIESLLDNGQLAVTTEEHPTHETYQIKGKYIRHRPIAPADMELVQVFRERWRRSVRSVFDEVTAEMLVIAIPSPAIAVDMEMREVYLQTPGPGAGGRLYPPPEVLLPTA